jgi:diphosphomevalonate decarboxylase
MTVYTSSWKAPSNIALIKYWGKKKSGIQLPANPSISFTLSNCATTTSLHFDGDAPHKIEVYLDGVLKPDFAPKIQQFIERISNFYPFIKNGALKINTSNSFPHSSGIASSASGMAALSLCVLDIAKKKDLIDYDIFFKQASILARLGSGSASRSIYGPLAVWGENQSVTEDSDEFALPFLDAHPIFLDFCDTILIVHRGQKTVSSTVGHSLLDNHPFAEARYYQAHQNLDLILKALKNGDLDAFISIVESEALTLHSLMMSSQPYFILMKPETLQIIEKIWKYRNEFNKKWCFTLDAGANVHFLYPNSDFEEAQQFISNELTSHCEDGYFINDQVGFGPQDLLNNPENQ